jgi:polysaccharide deacetylase family protein (PEP-CTERM system associated)
VAGRFDGFVLSFDLEDWHQLVRRGAGAHDWDAPHPAFERQVRVVLDFLDGIEVKATFFVLGMCARNYPGLVSELAERGHEVASHGTAHARVYTQTRDELRRDLEESVALLEELTGRRPTGYRAPAFSINRDTLWAYDVLAELGFRYDSSQYDSPRVPDRLGDIPQEPYRLGELWELPVTGGGSYWRVLPPRKLHELAVLYFHPYEFGPPLRPELPAGASAKQRLSAAKIVAWRNFRRDAVEQRLRQVARAHRLVSYHQAYGDIDRLYGTRTRALSPEGVLV